MVSSTHDDYTIAWICALPLEVAVARVMLNRTHSPLPNPSTDSNAYELGELDGHYIVITCLPVGVYGTVAAANVVSRMRSTFPRLQYGLMVGIGGGVPGKNNDIRLGDVVVSKPVGQHGGVIQYDYGKTVKGGKLEPTGALNKPPQTLLTHMSQLEAKRVTGSEDNLKTIMEEALIRNPDIEARFSPPEQLTDFLFESSYHHAAGEDTCEKCDKERLVKRKPRETRTPYIHYGLIASGNQVMKDSETRDRLALQHGILCFEMEAAGLMDELPTLVIRGICDYCDSHKQKQWQPYAAFTAAAYAKLLLSTIPALPVVNVDAKLREYYINPRNNRLRIKRLSGDALDMRQCYINLSMIEYKENDQNIPPQEKSLSSTFSLPNRLKLRADNPEKEVTLPQLFHERKMLDGRNARPRRILIRGRAGVGKTTLCKKIVHDFLHQQLWADLFDRIIWIPLRRLKGMSDLDEFFRQELFKHEAERDCLVTKLRKTALDQTHKKTLWLLDGLDEVSGYRNPSGADLTEIFNSLLNEDNVIITSRPHAVKLLGLTPFDLELETVGFHLNQVQAYLAKAVTDPDTVNQIYSFIQSHWLIQGLVRIPIQLDALCYSWDKDFRSGALLQTMTAVYQAIELKLWKKDMLNLEKRNNTGHNGGTAVRKLRTRLQIESQHMAPEMKFLECLAFTGLYGNIIEFYPGHRDWLYEQPEFCEMSDDVLDRLSFLRTSDASDQDKSYHFLHLTFQEFFAAQYFIRCWRSESSKLLIYLKAGFARETSIAKISPEKFLREEKYSGRYDVFWRFVTGLLYNIDKQQVCLFLEKIEEEPRDLLGPAHQRLLMHCFSEVPQLEDSGPVQSSNDSLLDLREKMERGCIQWSHYEDLSLKEMHLCSEIEFPEHVLCKLLQESSLQRESSCRKKILRALAYRWHMSFNLMDITTNFMGDSDSNVRRAAVEALGTQSPWSPNILEAVIRRLENDEDSGVRRAAIKALGTQSPWPPAILEAVIRQLENNRDSYIRHAAIKALGTQSSWSPALLEAVIRRLENDENSNVRYTAIKALGTQSPWSPAILEAVIRRLENDKDSGVRRAAIEALGTQSPWSPAILEAVIRRLEKNDETWDVRHTAINALGTQSPWSPALLEAVIRRLENNTEWNVRRAAINALSTQSPWSPAILEAVIRRLENDEDSGVRRAAIEALDTKSPLSPAILEAVIRRLENDEKWYVRRAAIEALRTQSPCSPNILEAVIRRLENDENSYVRYAAIEAIGTQSPWSPAILEAVIRRLENDEDSGVKRAAIEALGTKSPLSPAILEIVIRQLENDEGFYIRYAAIKTLGTQSSWSPAILKAMIHQLENNEDSDMRRAAIEALGKQSPWSPALLEAVIRRLENDEKWYVRRAAIKALSTQSLWSPDILDAVICRLENDEDSGVRRAAIKALSTQSLWSPAILEAVIRRLENEEDSEVASKIEALLWKHDEFLFPFFDLNANATSALCKIWAQRSIHEIFACYVRDGNACFETSDGRRSIPLSEGKIKVLKRTLWAETVTSPILRLVYRVRFPFASLES
ncbi:conserved hypothetical protein [Talaromyces marneffei ATCC 18224]|nr:conserved hypothetical protein [Talaromyces marneffei ATCC 18224]